VQEGGMTNPQGKIKRVNLRLREIRLKKGLTLKELSELCGKTYSELSRYERGETVATIDSLYAIARALKVKVDDLIERGEK
jgi:transcriptional regulator with XRE-family HTH domain